MRQFDGVKYGQELANKGDVEALAPEPTVAPGEDVGTNGADGYVRVDKQALLHRRSQDPCGCLSIIGFDLVRPAELV